MSKSSNDSVCFFFFFDIEVEDGTKLFLYFPTTISYFRLTFLDPTFTKENKTIQNKN